MKDQRHRIAQLEAQVAQLNNINKSSNATEINNKQHIQQLTSEVCEMLNAYAVSVCFCMCGICECFRC